MNKDVNDVLAQLEEEEKNEINSKEDKKILNSDTSYNNSFSISPTIIICFVIFLVLAIAILVLIEFNNAQPDEELQEITNSLEQQKKDWEEIQQNTQ